MFYCYDNNLINSDGFPKEYGRIDCSDNDIKIISKKYLLDYVNNQSRLCLDNNPLYELMQLFKNASVFLESLDKYNYLQKSGRININKFETACNHYNISVPKYFFEDNGYRR